MPSFADPANQGPAQSTVSARIVDGLNHLAIPINSVNLNPANTRRHLPEGIDLLKASLARYGQRKPIVVQRKGMVVRAGNGCLMAAKALGWDKIAAVVIDEESVEATAYEIMDNRSAEVGSEWDAEVLTQQLMSLEEDSFSLELTGWSGDELDEMLKRLSAPTDGELFDAFDDAGDTKGVDGLKQITLVLSEEDHERLMAHLAQYDKVPKVAIVKWLDASS